MDEEEFLNTLQLLGFRDDTAWWVSASVLSMPTYPIRLIRGTRNVAGTTLVSIGSDRGHVSVSTFYQDGPGMTCLYKKSRLTVQDPTGLAFDFTAALTTVTHCLDESQTEM